ncbi:CD209 antigen-like protein B [Cloeon dipterum]|uniref:CD209 antigen-like protein B n=1 Tax=Cloeon dipterum TaxID=197152 RepID=UPI00321F75E0
MDLKAIILLVVVSNSPSYVLTAIQQRPEDQVIMQQLVDSRDLLEMEARICNTRVNVVEEKLRGVTAQLNLSKSSCETRINALIENGKLQTKLCDFRVNLASQNCIYDNTGAVMRRTNASSRVAEGVAGKLLSPFPSSEYFFSTEELNWYSAARFCKSNGMELASIETEAENNAILQVIGKLVGDFWLSGTDLGSEGKFYWAGTGMDVEGFTKFLRGQPDNYIGEEHCLQFHRHRITNIGWNDNKCDVQCRFICEKTKN